MIKWISCIILIFSSVIGAEFSVDISGNVVDESGEVVVGAKTPIIIARACEGSIVKTKGKTRAKPDVPPIPGRIPTIKPSSVPAKRNAKWVGSKS